MPRSTVMLAVFLSLVVGTMPWWRLNITASVPVGLYRLSAVPAVLERGMLVVVPVPARVRPWHSAWLPLLKPVAAVAGDEVCQSDQTLTVNRVSYGVVEVAANGQPLPHMLDDGTCIVIDAGAVFLASTAPRSLDGRYFGVTPISTLTAAAHPLLPWR